MTYMFGKSERLMSQGKCQESGSYRFLDGEDDSEVRSHPVDRYELQTRQGMSGDDLVGLVSHPIDRHELQTRQGMSGCRIVEDPVRYGYLRHVRSGDLRLVGCQDTGRSCPRWRLGLSDLAI
jgi:hypothetical protein